MPALEPDAIYHLVGRDDWDARPAGDYRAASLASEGFIHCSFGHQVAATVGRHFTDPSGLLLLKLDAVLIAEQLVVEDTSGHGAFPHLYGPIPTAAVLAELPWAELPHG